MRMHDVKIKDTKGFTIVELLIAMFILIFVFLGAMFCFIKSIELKELVHNYSSAVLSARNRLAQIENTSYSQIHSTYDNVSFTANGLNGIGVTYVDDSNTDYLSVKAVFCWSEKNGRIIGEDLNLNAALDLDEDKNANGEIDSVAQVTTIINGL